MNDHTTAALDVLTGAQRLLDRRKYWMQTAYAEDAHGHSCGILDADVSCMCLYTAVVRAAVAAGHFKSVGERFPLHTNAIPGIRDLYDVIEAGLGDRERQALDLDTLASSLIIAWNDYASRHYQDVLNVLSLAVNRIRDRGHALAWSDAMKASSKRCAGH